jgi:hypothetical protein
MRTSMVATLAALLLISGAAFAQEQANGAPENAASASAKPLTVAGKVSNDRKTLMTDIDSVWMVSNPEALKGHEGGRVTVKCYVDTAKNKIQVLTVKRDSGETAYSAANRFDRR